ncbi:MAG: cytochrome c nitrite reductase small subunit [Candidatus Dadabacteria bacterium]|nr:cytochrome c nitrite reductase small subunit [Candidatus Dadabacteria bacterium]NIQ16104.1 cytochrome c nitrite reductase small subunit [Candidatus Dadabacteria bacterium]
MKKRAIILSFAVGALIGLGGYTFYYGEGLSYLSKDPKACVNCHIMQSQYNSWQKASHHTAATCVQCHLPQEFLKRYISKAVNGYNHSKAFTFQDFHEPIMITKQNSLILQNNCIECHRGITENLTHGITADLKEIKCVKCHREVGHGESVGLGGPIRPKEKGGS